MIAEFHGFKPDVNKAAFIAENATIIGNVTLDEGDTIWFGAVMRAETAEGSITVGKNTSIQDNCVVHVEQHHPVRIGNNVTVGHAAMVHGCTIEDDALIGMQATVLNGAVVGRGSIVAAGALVKEGQVVPPYSLVAGVPATVKKQLDPNNLPQQHNVEFYLREGVAYAKALGSAAFEG